MQSAVASTYLCVIPARGGSKGIPRKNLRVVGGRPLIEWTIRHALAVTERPVRVVVSTDDEGIREVAIASGAEAPFLRPAELSSDSASTEAAIAHALESLRALDGYEPTSLMLLQPTSPVRRDGFVDQAIQRFEQVPDAQSLVAVTELHPFIWRYADDAVPEYDPTKRPMRQDIAPDDHLYTETGSIYLTTVAAFERSHCRVSGHTVLFLTSKLESIDIDTEEDLNLADAILSNRTFA